MAFRRRASGETWLSVGRQFAQVAAFGQLGNEFGACLGSRHGFALNQPEPFAGCGGLQPVPINRSQEPAGLAGRTLYP